MTTNAKTVSTLSTLTDTYSGRATTAKAALDARAIEIKTRLDALLVGFGKGGYVKTEETDALIALLGASTVHAYVSAVRAARALTEIREDERTGAPTAPTHLPVATSTQAASKALVSASVAVVAAKVAPGVVDVTGVASWNYHRLAMNVRTAVKSAPAWPPVKVQRSLQAISGMRKHAELLAWAKKAGLTIHEAS